MVKKRFQYWASKDGNPYKEWTDWFEWDGDTNDKVQLKGYKGDKLLQEYKYE